MILMNFSSPVTKSGITTSSLKDRLWSLEVFCRWILKWMIAIGFFFIFLLMVFPSSIDYANNLNYFFAIFLSYVISGIIGFVFAYSIIRWILEVKMHRKVGSFNKVFGFSFRKIFIQMIKYTILTFIYYYGLRWILIQILSPYTTEGVAFFMVWVGIGVISDAMARLIYFLLKIT